METEGCLLHSLLQKKKSCLRLRVGPSLSPSPASSTVLELWPSGSGSSVLSHGSVCSVKKVVHGTLQCGVFNKMPSWLHDKDPGKAVPPEELFKFDAYKGDVLWMSPEW